LRRKAKAQEEIIERFPRSDRIDAIWIREIEQPKEQIDANKAHNQKEEEPGPAVVQYGVVPRLYTQLRDALASDVEAVVAPGYEAHVEGGEVGRGMVGEGEVAALRIVVQQVISLHGT